MKSMVINGKDIANGRVVKALEALLNGDDSLMGKWDEQFYYIASEVMGHTCWKLYSYNKLGTGLGQKYRKNDEGDFIKEK